MTNLKTHDRVLVTDHHTSDYRRTGTVLRVMTPVSLRCGKTCYDVRIDGGPDRIMWANQLFLITEGEPMKYKIRISGSNDFVAKINPDDQRCYPPGSVDLVHGWEAPAMTFDSIYDANRAADFVGKIEGFHTSVEEAK